MNDHPHSMPATPAACAATQGTPPADDLFIDWGSEPGEAASLLNASGEGGCDRHDAPVAAARSDADRCARVLPTIGVLLSGGLDSCVLVGRLVTLGFSVQPFYIRCGLAWEDAEQRAVRRFLEALGNGQAVATATRRESREVPAQRPSTDNAHGAACSSPAAIAPLMVFDQPVADLYGRHWSRTGVDVPDALSADEAVFLPGRNALLLVKPALWCAQRGISRVALAILKGNPFADATNDFFAAFARSLSLAAGRPLRFVRPCAHLEKTALIRLGRHLPLELSFSCIAPVADRHCGRCNKCAERRKAFAAAGIADRTEYADC